MADDQATLAGLVTIGPTCPGPVRLDRLGQCQDKPFAATLSIQTQDGSQEVAEVISDDQGQFSIQLDSGTYQIVPVTPPGSILPRGVPQAVTLNPGDVVNVTVHYDSGMR